MNQEQYDKIPWIDINLPWDANIDWSKKLPSPSLEDREKEVFGTTLSELEEANKRHVDACIELQNKLYELKSEASRKAIEENRYNEHISEWEKFEAAFWAEHAHDECVVARDAYIDLRHKIYEWSDEQPEWKAWRKVRAEFIAEEEKKSFTGRKLNVPGTIVEMEDGSIEFIGSMNTIAGVCNDCVAFERDNLIVKRYALVYPFTKRKANDDFYADE